MRDEIRTEIFRRYGKYIGQTIVGFFETLKIDDVYFLNGKISFPNVKEDVERLMEILSSSPRYKIFSLGMSEEHVSLNAPQMTRGLKRQRKGFFVIGPDREVVDFLPYLKLEDPNGRPTTSTSLGVPARRLTI